MKKFSIQFLANIPLDDTRMRKDINVTKTDLLTTNHIVRIHVRMEEMLGDKFFYAIFNFN